MTLNGLRDLPSFAPDSHEKTGAPTGQHSQRSTNGPALGCHRGLVPIGIRAANFRKPLGQPAAFAFLGLLRAVRVWPGGTLGEQQDGLRDRLCAGRPVVQTCWATVHADRRTCGLLAWIGQ